MCPDPYRRRLLKLAAAILATGGQLACSKPARTIPIADLHSHYGMITRRLENSGLADDMREQRVALMTWSIVPGLRWLRITSHGIGVIDQPSSGDLATMFNRNLISVKTYASLHRLKIVLTPADVETCIAGNPGIVLAAEGADFLDGRIENLDSAYSNGLRNLQFVHYTQSQLGDRQTAAPTHGGLSQTGKQLIEACNAKGILIDLAHLSPTATDQALDITRSPVIWSHGWVSDESGRWQDPYSFLQRRLSLAHAKRIANAGGIIGLWAFALPHSWVDWSVTRHNTHAYAQELANLINKIGADHVAFGTDLEGVEPNWSVNDYEGVATVIDHLQKLKLPDSVIERLAYGNYARVLKTVLRA